MSELLSDIALFGENIPWLEGIRSRGRNAFVMPTAKTEAW